LQRFFLAVAARFFAFLLHFFRCGTLTADAEAGGGATAGTGVGGTTGGAGLETAWGPLVSGPATPAWFDAVTWQP
jgi:hypothetical protein